MSPWTTPDLRSLAKEEPRLFLERFPPPVLIDEVHYAPELFPFIKMAVDREGRPGMFWLTGSQQFPLMQGITETLAGRVAIVQLLGFSRREAEQRPASLDPFVPTLARIRERSESAGETSLLCVFERIWLGSFLALVTGAVRDRDLFMSSYLTTYLERDVRDLAQIGDRTAFLKFLRAFAARTGQMLNLSDLARDVDVTVPTAKRWLSILEASMQIFLLQPWHTNLTKRLAKRPKLYFLDTGLCAYLTRWLTPESLAHGAMAGAIFETFVVTEILKSWWHRGGSPAAFYLHDRDGHEIDLLLDQDGALYPVEIKLSGSPRREWIRTWRNSAVLGPRVGEGAVVCLSPQLLPLSERDSAMPVGAL